MLINLFTDLSIDLKLNNDINILRLLIRTPPHDIKIYDYKHTTIRDADLSIYLDYINTISIHKKGKHVMITDNTSKENILYYLSKLDYIYCKTHSAEDYFADITHCKKIRYMGWTMMDKLNNKEFISKKTLSYYTFAKIDNIDLLFKLIQDWPIDEKLNVYCSIPKDNELILDLVICNKINLYFDKLPNESVFIQLTKERFGYELLEEASTGSVLITQNIELVNYNDQYIWNNYYDLLNIIQKGVDDIENRSNKSRKIFIDNQYDFLQNFTKNMTKLFQSIIDKSEPIVLENNNLEKKPLVSIITPTYNRSNLFKVALFVWNSLTYQNREWIIVDDGDEPLNLPEDSRIIYLKLDKQLNIGLKRNIAIENSNGDYILCMDDDDFYPANIIEHRLLTLGNVDCSYCSTIACYNIYKNISFINSPSIYDRPDKRVSEATLFFKRGFWLERGFPIEKHLGEGEEFIEGRYDRCKELDWSGIIISLIHTNNISGKIHSVNGSNGNHWKNFNWGFTEDFLKLLETL
jgi:hypothetical protein